MIGAELTVIVLIAAAVQPNADEPVTVKLAVIEGLTTLEPPEKVYELAPLGISVKELPLQIVPLFTETFGAELTETVLVQFDKQPVALAPVTV